MALHSIYRHNFKNDFWTHPNPQRIYAINDEKGLVLCSWPKGGRPALPFVYSDEVWTGIEYQVAAHLIYRDMVEEGLAIVKGIGDRYDGVRRNPWNQIEWGNHYSRALASYSVLLALSGFRYSAVTKTATFQPRMQEAKFACFSPPERLGAIPEERARRVVTCKTRVPPRRNELVHAIS